MHWHNRATKNKGDKETEPFPSICTLMYKEDTNLYIQRS